MAPDVQTSHAARRLAGIACLGLSPLFLILALYEGLRGAPEGAASATVVAALVVAHAIVAVGAGAFGFGLLRMAERLLDEDRARKTGVSSHP
jgi:hypothetical protein